MDKFMMFFLFILITLISFLTDFIMKKQLLFALFVCFGLSLQAQSFSAGLKAGRQYSNYTKIKDSKGTILYHAGVHGTYSLTDRFALQTEVLLSRQGQNAKDKSTKERAMYLNVPVLAKYQVLPRLNVLAGGQIGFLMRAKLLPGEKENGIDKVDLKHKYESTTLAGVVGVEYQLSDRWSFDARYNLGFGPFHKQLKDSRQNVFQVSAAYRLVSF
ncbi:MAG: hypothetical protein DHS20C18_39090 [Saprospiraceae bacterium]|nr:MAG: hypothetical protein DHS20C18_39090 [Saprospiraceae bacterium]